MENLSRQKSYLRKRIKDQQHRWVNDPSRTTWDQQIVTNLSSLMPKGQGVGAAFVSLSDEPKIWPEVAQRTKWRWALPKMTGQELEFLSVSGVEDLKPGLFGVREPDEVHCPKVTIQALELFCIPGLAFDSSGARLGRGKGFYDRALGQVRGLKIGVCYNSQFLNEVIPMEDHDVRMDYVVTEKNIHKVKA